MIKWGLRFRCWMTKATTHTQVVCCLLFFQSNNGYTNVPQYYVIVRCLYCTLAGTIYFFGVFFFSVRLIIHAGSNVSCNGY